MARAAVLLLTRSEVASVLDMAEVIREVETAHAALAAGSGADLGGAQLAVPASTALLIPMTAALPPAAGVKILTDTPANASRSLPTQQSTIVLVDTTTGACDAVLDGAAITLYRTAAASAVASRYLARKDASVLGLVGAGRLARTHLLAISLVRDVDRVLVWSWRRAGAEAFAASLAEVASERSSATDGRGPEVRVASSAEEVVRGADILCTLTPSPEPLVSGAWFKPGLHVNAVGAPPRPDHRELDTEAVTRARLVVDNRNAVARHAGDLLIPLAEGAIEPKDFDVELGQIILGERPGRCSPEEITVYKSVGIGIQDVAAARAVVAAARRRGVGTEVALGR
jgi:alanine dehydrogenase